MERLALVVGVEGRRSGLTDDELEPRYPRLAFAGACAEELRDILSKDYGYTLSDHASDPAGTARALGEALTDVFTGDGRFAVIHLVAHGEPTRNQEDGLRAVGGDGQLTEDLSRWIRMAEGRVEGETGPTVLFILDLCFSGRVVLDHLRSLIRPERRNVWVLAATHAGEPAYDGRLSRAVAAVLQGFVSGSLRLDESVEHVPLERFCKEVARHVEAQSQDYPQHVERTLTALGDDLSHLAFFRNPRYDPEALLSRGQLDPMVLTLCDEGVDVGHFTSRAAGSHSAYGIVGRPLFTGRVDQLRALGNWIGGEGPSLRVVTGKPGSGKSAILGMLVCAAHPQLRPETERVWRAHATQLPRKVPDLAVIHARRRSLVDVIASLARQWHLGVRSDGRPWTTDTLVAALARRPSVPTLVLDALDEAEHPADLATALVLPLANSQGEGGRPLCRVLVATRPDEELRHLLETARSADSLLELDLESRAQLHADLSAYVAGLLRPQDDAGAAWCSLPVAEAVADAVADALLVEDLAWGEFLVAGLYARFLRERCPAPEGATEARALGADVPRTLDGMLDIELAERDTPALGQLLAALAWAEGEGMPEELLACVAELAAVGAETGERSPVDTAELLESARFYLRRAVDRDGSPLYRLFHQGLADRLRLRPGLDAAEVWARLAAWVGAGPGRVGRWASAEPYLLRHAARHAAAAGRLVEVLADPEFLVHADPQFLADELYQSEHDPRGAVYLASFGAHHAASTAERRNILAIDAVRHQERALADALTAATRWSIGWTAGRDVPTGLVRTLLGHSGQAVLCLAGIEIDGRAHLLSGGQDGTVRLWDLESAATTHVLRAPGSAITHVAAVSVLGRPAAVTASENGVMRCWDLLSGREMWQSAAPSEDLRAMVALRMEGRWAVATGGAESVVRFWDAADGSGLGAVGRGWFGGNVEQLVRIPAEGTTDRMLIRYDSYSEVAAPPGAEDFETDPGILHRMSTIAVFEDRDGLETVVGDRGGTLSWGDAHYDDAHADEVTDLQVTWLDGTPYALSASGDGTARMLSLRYPYSSRPVAKHTTWVNALAVVPTFSRALLLTAGDHGTVRVWDLAGTTVRQRSDGHSHWVNGLVALSRGRVASSGEDGRLLVWDGLTGAHTACQVYCSSEDDRRERARAVAVLADGATPTLVAACAENGLFLWDPTAEEMDPVSGDLDPDARTAVVCFDHDGGRSALTAGSDGAVTLWTESELRADGWSVPEGEGPRVLFRTEGAAWCVAATPGGDQVCAGDATGNVWIAGLDGEADARVVTRHGDAVWAVAAVEVGGVLHVLSSARNGSLRLSVADGSSARELVGHTRDVFAVEPVLLDGRPHALTGGLDRTMRLWDLSDGREVDVFWFPDTVFAITVTDEGAVFVGVGPDLVRMDPDPERLPLRPVLISATPGTGDLPCAEAEETKGDTSP